MFNMEVVTPDYFRTFGLRVLRGRALTDDDRNGAEPVVVISESTARLYWPGQDPIGKRLFIDPKLDKPFTVVGVVPDTRYRDLRQARASVYYPLAQSVFPFAPTTLVIRTAGPPARLVPTVRQAINETAPGVALASAAPFYTYMEGPLAQPRLNAFLLAVFALAAAALAAIGLFGVMATMVRQRTRELGVRMALGATARHIQSMVVGRGLAIAGVGVAVGLTGALVANRLLSALLYETSATDTGTLAGVALFLTAIAAVATFIPARSSARIDPAVALRSEG
jgi:ABC-type antimicrobial peptide transport system permease subunit